ncbi:MATE family efflux transporter [Salana multivorans]
MSRALTSGSPLKLIVLFAVPMFLGLMFQQLYHFVDALVVGRVLGIDALAAVGASGGIVFLLLGFTMGMANGLAIPVARAFGAGDAVALRRAVAAGALLAAAMSVLLSLVGLPLARQLLVWLQTPPDLLPQATTFLTVLLAGAGTLVAFNYLSGIIRALGDSTTPLVFLAISSLLNVALVIVLVGWLQLGIAGAALATVLAQLASVLACLWLIARRMPQLRPRREDSRPARAELVESLRIGLPMGFQMLIIAIGTLVLQYAINGLGSGAVAAFTAGSRVDALAMAPLQAFGMAVATYAAQNRGAAAWSRIGRGVTQTAWLAAGVAIVVGVACIAWGDRIIASFTSADAHSDEIIATAHTMLLVNGSLYAVLALLFVFRAALQGLGHTGTPTLSGLVELFLRSAAALVLVDALGFLGAVLAAPLAWFGGLVPLWWAWERRRRELATRADGTPDPRIEAQCERQARTPHRRLAPVLAPSYARERVRAHARARAEHRAHVRQCELASAAVLAELAMTVHARVEADSGRVSVRV